MTEADQSSDTKANGETSAVEADSGSASAPGSGRTRESSPSSPPGSSPPASDKSDEKNEIAKLRDQYLRTAADFENYRKRTRREVDDAQRRGRESALKDLLPVLDNLERAAAHAQN